MVYSRSSVLVRNRRDFSAYFLTLDKFEGSSWFEKILQSPEAISLVEALEKGKLLSLHGVAEAGKPFLINLLAAATKRPLCVLASTIKQQEHFYSEATALAHFSPHPLQLLLFPEMETATVEALPDLEVAAEILNALRALQQNKATPIIITTEKALKQTAPSPSSLKNLTRFLQVGKQHAIKTLEEELMAWGYEKEGQVNGRGQFARRGGILDLFPLPGEAPVRIEFNGDEIESMRLFNVETQMSVMPIAEMEFTALETLENTQNTASLTDYLPEDYLGWREFSDGLVEVGFLNHGNYQRGHRPRLQTPIPQSAGGVGDPADDLNKTISTKNTTEVTLEIFGHDFLAAASLDPILQEQRHELLLRQWQDWIAEGHQLVVCCNNEGEEHRLQEWLKQSVPTAHGSRLTAHTIWLQAPLLQGFSWPSAHLVVLSDAEIFGRYQTLRMMRLQQKVARAHAKRETLDFSQFIEGDLVVHIHHGVSRFLGICKIDVERQQQEVLTLEYRDGALLHVPVEQAYLVGRYVGVGKGTPPLDELGGSRWKKAAAQAQKAIIDYAAILLKVEAERKAHQGFLFAPDTAWQKEFEDSFLFEETPDQLTAIHDTKSDMESDQPMDRLICGDVGFGKTEVAIRAAFKAVMSGKQVAVLTPTTVLAQQHERTFRERMADYPIQIDLVSRFRSKAQQRKTLTAARDGTVDILIGTHRLLQPDVTFKNLGLVVVDEEQRFGVKHKEQFKQRFWLVDILTLSATPIPRTLYLSLMGAKDISIIETPPTNRFPIETIIAAYDERLIRSAIERELARGGQVYFLHNRVHSIQRVRDRIKELVPTARVEIGHGQMDEDELEAVMLRFVSGEVDVLVATTIIESGLDIPRANTIIIHRADQFGLADLYQLRGRVGRSQMKAHAYLLLPRYLMIEPHKLSGKRVSAIKQYSQLGAGFKVAMRDLEIRGAGNILGTKQSGHATAIGFDLYCQLLKETLARMKGEKVLPRIEVSLRLDFISMSEDDSTKTVGAYIPRAYMNESRQRIEAYRKLAEINQEKELRILAEQWRDRFGKLPQPVLWLLDLSHIRLAAAATGISSIEVEDGKVMLRKRGRDLTVNGKLPRLTTLSSPSDPAAEANRKFQEILGWIELLGNKSLMQSRKGAKISNIDSS